MAWGEGSALSGWGGYGACGTVPELFRLRKLMGARLGGRDGDMEGMAETDIEKTRGKEILRPEKENKKNKRRGGKEVARLGKKPRERQRTRSQKWREKGGQDTTKSRGN